MGCLFLTLVWLQRVNLCQISVVPVPVAPSALYRAWVTSVFSGIISSARHCFVSCIFPSRIIFLSWGTAFNILPPGLMMVNSFNFYVWNHPFVSPWLFLRYIFFVYRILGVDSFLFLPFGTFSRLFFSLHEQKYVYTDELRKLASAIHSVLFSAYLSELCIRSIAEYLLTSRSSKLCVLIPPVLYIFLRPCLFGFGL